LIGVVTTTIQIPRNLPEIYRNTLLYDRADEVQYYIIGDKGTPVTRIQKYLGSRMANFQIYSLKDQKKWLRTNFGRKKARIYQTVFQERNYQRRIIGFLIAAQDGASMIIALDDDNYPTPIDFIGEHSRALSKEEGILLSSDLTYVNLVDFLEKKPRPSHRIYVRGYPLHLRGEPSYTLNRGQWNPGVNIGLWIGDPDIEAISRIGCPDIVVDLPLTIQFHSLGVEKNNFTSMCLQNLSFKTDVLVTQYEFPMNVQMGSLKLGRYDDIWAGYVCKKILDRIDRHMIFGPPIAEHRRNPHDLFKDLINEFWGMYLNSFFYTAIQEITLEEKDAFSCFIELITKLSKRIRFTDSDINGYFLRVFTDMLLWAEMIDKLF